MGCGATKFKTAEEKFIQERQLESVPRAIAPPPNPTLDHRLPLTSRQKVTLMKSWKEITRALKPTGVSMFIR